MPYRCCSMLTQVSMLNISIGRASKGAPALCWALRDSRHELQAPRYSYSDTPTGV